MKVLVTGSDGFIGKNLVAALGNIRDGKDKTTALSDDLTIYPFDVDTESTLLDAYCADCDFVFNLAGVNRPKDPKEYMRGNFGFASRLLDTLKAHGNTCPIMLSSSTQAELQNPYGEQARGGRFVFPLCRKYGRKGACIPFSECVRKMVQTELQQCCGDVLLQYCTRFADYGK